MDQAVARKPGSHPEDASPEDRTDMTMSVAPGVTRMRDLENVNMVQTPEGIMDNVPHARVPDPVSTRQDDLDEVSLTVAQLQLEDPVAESAPIVTEDTPTVRLQTRDDIYASGGEPTSRRHNISPAFPGDREVTFAMDMNTLTDVQERRASFSREGLTISQRREIQQTQTKIYARSDHKGVTIQDSSHVNLSMGSHDNGTMDQNILEIKIDNTKTTFAETENYSKVERILKSEGHVTISGASGEGKTSLALMLGLKHREYGYDLIFVNDVDRFRLDEHMSTGRKIFLIFDDIFGTVGLSTDVPQLRQILHDLRIYMEDKISKRKTSRQLKSSKLRVVFTTKSYNLECGMSKLEGQEFFFFKGPSVIDLTRMKSYKYSFEDKQKIFQKHRENHELKLDMKEIYDAEQTMFGFPLICKLFFEFDAFQSKSLKFFKEPLFYLRLEIKRLLEQRNENSAALIMMLLLDGQMNLMAVETEFQNETQFSSVRSIISNVTGAGLARAARNLRGTFFTEGDIIGFSHPTIYDACACALYKIAPTFVLENCTIKFLYERLDDKSIGGTTVSDHLHVIYVSEVYNDVIAKRLAEAIGAGQYSMSITHPILKRQDIVDKVFDILQLKKTNLFDRLIDSAKNKKAQMLHSKDGGKHLLYWTVQSQSLYLVQKVLKVGYDFTDAEITDAFLACASCGNLPVMKFCMSRFTVVKKPPALEALTIATQSNYLEIVRYLLESWNFTDAEKTIAFVKCASMGHLATMQLFMSTFKTVIQSSIRNALIIATENNFSDMVHYLLEFCRDLSYVYCGEENVLIIARTLSRTKIEKDIISTVCRVKDVKITSEDISFATNELLHVACARGDVQLANLVLPVSGINTMKDGFTPVMKAAHYSRRHIVYLLISKGADLTLTGNEDNNVLHYAVIGGDIYIVGRLLPLFDINIKGQYGRTPVMLAANIEKTDVFDLLVSKGADLTLTDNYNGNVLHNACLGGSTYIVEHLLPLVDINIKGEYGRTPVMLAANIEKTDVFDLLVSKGADLTLTDNDGNNVLHNACLGGSTYIVEQLLPLFDINIKGEYGRTPVMLAANIEKTDVFDLLVSKGADLTLTDNDGNNVLQNACLGGSTYIVEQLLPLFDINIKGQYGRTPVMKAAIKGKRGVFDLLVSKGADLTLTDNDGNNVLHNACLGGSTYIVEQLLPLFDINIKGHYGRTPVMLAANIKKTDVFDLLVSKGADLTLTDNYNGNVLHHACLGGSTYIVEQLLPLFDINVKGQYGRTPVMLAANIEKTDVFDLLVSKGADLTLTDNDGHSVLHNACLGGSTYIVEQLLPLFDINIKGQYGRTPVMAAANIEKTDVFDLLVSKGADLTLTGNDGDNVLHNACLGGSTYIVEHLLPLFDINIKGEYERTPVMAAANIEKTDVFDLLVSKGADLTLTDNDGHSVLHNACLGGSTYIVEQLLPLFDINIKGQYGRTPVMLAANIEKTDVFDLLVSKGADLTLTDNGGNNVLQNACLGGSTYIVEQLLPLFDINIKGQYGRTPVMRAAIKGKRGVFDLLVSKGADLTLTDNDGNNVLDYACLGGSTYIVEQLLPLFDINIKGQYGHTPVMAAANRGKRGVFDLLVSKGADLTLTDNYNGNVLHNACLGGSTYIVEQLLPLFDINIKGQYGRTPVMAAANRGKRGVFDLLVSKGADLTLTDNYNGNVLHNACLGGSTYIVEQLLPLFDINIKGQYGRTPVMLAANNEKTDVFDLLVSKGADLTLTDNDGHNVLHNACLGGSTYIVEQLLPLVDINS